MEIKCDYCGKIFEYEGGIAHYKRNRNHYCSTNCQGNGNNIKQGNKIHGLAKRKNKKQDKRYRIWTNIKKRAKQKGILFNLKIEDVPEIPVYCPVLGIKIKENDTNAPLDSSPSLDRTNPKKGYTKENVRTISNRANRLKFNYNINEIKLILRDAIKNENL
ncbi:MAG: hypothetical protein ACOCP4_04460 [Candidatus Woesearchaeota archaeon]